MNGSIQISRPVREHLKLIPDHVTNTITWGPQAIMLIEIRRNDRLSAAQ